MLKIAKIMKDKFNFNKISKALKKDGYFIFENYFSNKELKNIKESLLETLNYIKPSREKDLQKKYYEIKKYNKKLKGNWYNLAPYNIGLLKSLHKDQMIKFVKKFYKTSVVFSGRPAIHVHDDENLHLLDPHQETSQFARDTLVFWSPLYDTNQNTGGMAIYKDSHRHGYFRHSLEHPRFGSKSWTKQYTHVSPRIAKKFKRLELNVKAGSAVLFLSSLIHSGYQTKKKQTVRITITERFNPLKKIPYLKNHKATIKIPFTGINYNRIHNST